VSVNSCLYCLSQKLDQHLEGIRDRLKHVSGEWSFLKCRSCGSALLSPFPNETELASFYPPVYSVRPDTGQEGSIRRLIAVLRYKLFFKTQYQSYARRVLKKCVKDKNAKLSILDIGCGSGLRLDVFQKYGHEVHGIDLQPEAIRYARKNLKITAVCADAMKVTEHFKSQTFDLIISSHMLEHVRNVYAFLSKCFQLLKPGGWLAATVPLIDSNQARFFSDRWTGVTEAPRHLSVPSTKGILHSFQAAGFQLVELQPSPLFDCVGAAVLSVLPGCAITHLEKRNLISAALQLIASSVVSVVALPWCVIDNYLMRKPSIGIVFAQKPFS